MVLDPQIANRNLDQLKSTPRGAVVLRNLHGTLREPHFTAHTPSLRQAVLDGLESILNIDEPTWTREMLATAAGARLNARGLKRAGPACYIKGVRDNLGFAHTMHHSKAVEYANPLIEDHSGAVSPDEGADLPPPELREGATLGSQYGLWWFTHYDEIIDPYGVKRTGVDLLSHLGFAVDGRNGRFLLVASKDPCQTLTAEARRPTVLDGAHHPRLKVRHIDAKTDCNFGASADLRGLPKSVVDGVREAVAPPLKLDGLVIELESFSSHDTGDPHDEDLHFSAALDAIVPIDDIVRDLKLEIGLP